MADENNITTLAKRLRPFIKMAAQEMVPVTPYDHGALSGLADDDHSQYVHNTQARTITAVHTFDPTTSTAPFILAADAQGQTVIGLKADQLAKAVTAGAGLTGGGNLTDNISLAVGAGSGISVGADSVGIDLGSPSGLTFDSGLVLADTVAGAGLNISSKILSIRLGSPSGLEIDVDNLQVTDGIAGNGLTISSKVLAVGQGDGLTISANAIALTTPGTCDHDSANSSTGNHTHLITNSSNPGAGKELLSTDAYGALWLITLRTDTIGDRSGASLLLNPTGDISMDPGGNDVLPVTNYEINLGTLNKKYLTLHAAELWVETLVAHDTLATIGGRILVAPTTTLTRDLAAASVMIYTKHNQMAVGDIAYLEADGKVEFISIDDSPTLQAQGDYLYPRVTRNLDGSGANDWYAGDAILNTGTTGDGYIDIYSVHSIRSGVHYGPTIVGNIRTGTTYNNLIEGWAIGNLNGLYGYGADTYGAAFGKYANSSPFLTVDPTNGIRMMYKNGLGANLTLAQWDISGNLIIGQTGSGQDNVYISSGAISLRVNTTTYVNLTTGGVITIGQVAASQDNIYMSAGGIAIRNNTTDRIEMSSAGVLTINDSGGAAVFTFNSSTGAEFTKPLTIGSSGGIYQGTGTFASPTTGLKIYNSSGIGIIAGYNGGVVQWYAGTDGKLYAGAGKVTLDAGGIKLTRGLWGDGTNIGWYVSGIQRSGIYSNDGGMYFTNWDDSGGYKCDIIMDCGSTLNPYGYVAFQAGSGAYWSFENNVEGEVRFTWSNLCVELGVHIGNDYGATYDDDLIVDGGIWVGRTADPTVGHIGYTGALHSYKNSTDYTGYIYVPLTTNDTSTLWDGDLKSTTSKTLIDLSVAFGLPAGMKAISVRLVAEDSGSSGGEYYFGISPNNTAYEFAVAVRLAHETNGDARDGSGICPCDANGDVYYQIAASGASTMACWFQITGYWI